MFHLAHISDLHLPNFCRPSIKELFSKRITGYYNWKLNRSHFLNNNNLDALLNKIFQHKPDHIAITGDIVNLALDSEFKAAQAWLSQWDEEGKAISLTLGNHDVYVRGAFQKSVHAFKCWLSPEQVTAPESKGSCSSQAIFPFYRLRGDLAIISLSSAIVTPFFCAFGYVDKKQREALKELLIILREKNYFRIVLIHHPPLHHAAPPLKRLYGMNALQRLFAQEGAELILHGHTHLPTLSYLKGPASHPIPVVGVSSAAQNFGGHKPPAGYNWFQISKEQGRWQCVLSRYMLSDKQQNFSLMEERIISR